MITFAPFRTHKNLVRTKPSISSTMADIEFRAPPPSPVAGGRRSGFANEEILADFLERSVRVPDLVLPDGMFPRREEPPAVIDFHSGSVGGKEALHSIRMTGCLQIVNCGIPGWLVPAAMDGAAAVFGMSPDTRSGFDEDEQSDLSQEFVWCGHLEGVLPLGYSHFREQMETLKMAMERVAKNIYTIFLEKENSMDRQTFGNGVTKQGEEAMGMICCVHTHRKNMGDGDQWLRSLKYDVMRMLIRGCGHSHALSFHVCDGFSEFHLYSKRGWLSFCPHQGAILVTIGDQIQAISGGKYKQVMGRAIYKGGEKCVSMAFLYSPPSNVIFSTTMTKNEEKTISVCQQAMIALLLTIAYQFLAFICKKF